jgi:DNA-binding transcriptional regulator YiaG
MASSSESTARLGAALRGSAPLVDAVELCTPLVRSDAGARADVSVVNALRGDYQAARLLVADSWEPTIRILFASLNQEGLAESERPALLAHLAKLPALATVYDQPARALCEWAVIGVREVIAMPVKYPRAKNQSMSTFLDFERAVIAAVGQSLTDVTYVKRLLGVTNTPIARWCGVSTSAVSSWDRLETTPSPEQARLLSELKQLAQAFEENIASEHVRALFSNTSVPALDGMTYEQALDAGVHADQLADVLRFAVGEPVLTDAGRTWARKAMAAGELSDADPSAISLIETLESLGQSPQRNRRQPSGSRRRLEAKLARVRRGR